MRRTRSGAVPPVLAIANECSHMVQLGRWTVGHGFTAPFLLHTEGTYCMADERDENLSNNTNDSNDAREEDIVSDTDADTQDVIENAHENFDANERRFSGIEATLDKILGEIASLREAQGIMVENGAVVHDVDSDIGHNEEDEFIPPREMDLLI